jgi:hypothetical protein
MEWAFKNLSLSNRSSLSDIIDKACREDDMFITKFAGTKSDGTVIKNFQFKPCEGLDNDRHGRGYRQGYGQQYGLFHNYESKSGPALFECNIYGEIEELENGPYGNWIPDVYPQNPLAYSRYQYTLPPTILASSGLIAIKLSIHPVVADALKVLDNATKEYMNQIGTEKLFRYHKVIHKDLVTLTYPLVVPLEEWSEYAARSEAESKYNKILLQLN